MITLSYWQFAAIAYGISTLTYWCVESKVLFDEAAGLDRAWQRAVYPLLMVLWLPVLTIGVPIRSAIVRRQERHWNRQTQLRRRATSEGRMMEHVSKCTVCGTTWTAGDDTLPCPTPELHKQSNQAQPNYEAMQRRIEYLESLEHERQRSQHHDVLCLVLKELVRDDRANGLDTLPAPTINVARAFADLAYPPPKAEP